MSRMSGADLPSALPITYRQQYRRCGKAGCARCAAGQPGHGPYWYAYWWEGGRRRSRCLGTQAPGAVAAAAGAAAAGAAAVAAPAPPPGAALRVRTLGAFAVWRGDTLIAAEQWTSRRAAGLFKCLLSTAGHRLLREQAIEWLWPEADPAAGAHNLRTAVHLLRRILDGPESSARHPRTGASHLRTEGDLLVLAPAGDAAPPPDWLDAMAFAHAADAALAGQEMAACRAALARYGGDYLPDDPYAEWAAPVREALRRQYLAVLLHLAALSGAQGVLEEAETCLRRVLAAEPSHEEAAATLMGLLAASERRGEALRVYQALATALEEELDATPSAALAALRARLLAQEAAPLAVQRPPLRGQPVQPTNLPLALTSFVGRTHEVGAIQDALAADRLVTLTGPGGCGKTRLALAVADRLVDTAAYPDGVWLVELAGLADSALVPRAVAAALGVGEQAGQPLRETLVAFLRPRHLLLVLDNCEHLIAACTQLATYILQACPHLRVLATSRERLTVPGERTYLVPSLAVPDPARLPPLEQLAAYEAVQLFLQRAQAQRPAFALTAANAVAAAQICARLDGLPLAIELAAARLAVLPVETVAARLDDRFRLLTGGPRTALPRQQTLRATLDWSYALLSTPEQRVLNRLAVFAGGCTLEAAEAVCAGPGVEAGAVLDLLAGLVNKSLVRLEASGQSPHAEARYRLLDTVRQYAWERLVASAEAPEMRAQHAAYYLALAEQAEPELHGPAEAAWLDRLEGEHDNLRAALAWSLGVGVLPAPTAAAIGANGGDSVDTGVRLVGALWWFWFLREHRWEGQWWLERALAQAAAVAPLARAKALLAAGDLAAQLGDPEPALALLDESVALYRAVGEPAGLAYALSFLGRYTRGQDVGFASGHRGDYTRGTALLEESLALARAEGDPWLIGWTLAELASTTDVQRGVERAYGRTAAEESLTLLRAVGHTMGVAAMQRTLGWIALYEGDVVRAGATFTAELATLRTLGDRAGVAFTLSSLGDVARAQGDDAAAVARYEESLALYRDLDFDREWMAGVLRRLGEVALDHGDWRQARTYLGESLRTARTRGAWGEPQIAPTLEALAGLAASQGHAERALRLVGAAAALRARLHQPLWPQEQATLARWLTPARQVIPAQVQGELWAAGQGLTLDEAIALTLTVPSGVA